MAPDNSGSQDQQNQSCSINDYFPNEVTTTKNIKVSITNLSLVSINVTHICMHTT